MKAIGDRRHRIFYSHFAGLLILALVLAAQGLVDRTEATSRGWELEQGVDEPSYARIEPTESNLNIDVLVLACALAQDATVLQLELYWSTEGPLMPQGAEPDKLRPDPRVMLVIDGRSHQLTMFSADDHIVMADAVTGRMPSLSKALVDAIQNANDMIMRFELTLKAPEQPSSFDGVARFNVRANEGGAAVAVVRRCITADTGPFSETESRPSDAARTSPIARQDRH